MDKKKILTLCLAAVLSTAVSSSVPVSREAGAEEVSKLISNDFESGLSGWSGRGSASVAQSSDSSNGGSSSMLVSKRAASWNGAVIDLGSGFSGGNTYGFEAYVMPNGTSSSESFKLSLQYSSGGTVSYDAIAEGTASKGEWTKLSNPAYTIPAGATDLMFYIETVDTTSDFYVDDVAVTGSASAPVTPPSTPVSNKKVTGDINSDGSIDTFDLISMRQLSGTADIPAAKLKLADINGDKQVNDSDMNLLSDYLLGKISEFPAIENPGGSEVNHDFEKSYDFPSVSSLPSSKDIPDPFIFMDGSKVETEEDWWRRQSEISCLYEYYMYGKWIDGSDDETSYTINGNKMTITVKRKSTGKTASFNMVINKPSSVRHEGGAPVILGMHKGISESTATSKGYAVITYDSDGMFSAPGTAQDNNQHKGAFYDLYPYGNSFDTQTGDLMAWSWGISRTLDALYAGAAEELNINPDSSIVTGVSRYGKAAAVCGAFETRIKMCAPSCSGAGGLALYRYSSVGKTYNFSSRGGSSSYTYSENEPLGSLQASGEQGWFNGKFMEFKDVNKFPMDQHMLGALCCDPNRYLFIIGSCQSEDWVNAPSVWMAYCGMKPIYDFVGLGDHVAINIHKEGHAVIAEDIEKMVQYFDYHVYGINPTMDLADLQTSVFAEQKNYDPFQDSMTSKWIH